MHLCFELSMPNVGSWNGRWSGEGNRYLIIQNFRSKKDKINATKLLAQKSWYYYFGDGWGALVSVKEVSPTEARKLKRISAGFAGYDWMIKSIIDSGKILNSLGKEHG